MLEGGIGTRVQIASDLHIEHYLNPTLEELGSLVVPAAPILALLGDIGIPTHQSYSDFLMIQAERFEAVLVLTGNHEYYDVQAMHDVPPPPKMGDSMEEWTLRHSTESRLHYSAEDMEEAIEVICARSPKLHYVDNVCVRLGAESSAPALLCTPLWSHIPENAMDVVAMTMNDYCRSYIRVAQSDTVAEVATCSSMSAMEQLSPEVTSHWHDLAVGWLQHEIARLKQSGCECISVLSHHAPSKVGCSRPEYEAANDAVNHAFSTDLSPLYGPESSLRLWVYGHTHYNNDRLDNGTRLVSNQRGYKDKVQANYKSDFTIDIASASVGLPELVELVGPDFNRKMCLKDLHLLLGDSSP